MKEILDKYLELSIIYKNLCYKVKEENFFIIGIKYEDSLICYNFDIKYYNLFDVQELDNLNDFNKLERANLKLLINLNFDNKIKRILK